MVDESTVNLSAAVQAASSCCASVRPNGEGRPASAGCPPSCGCTDAELERTKRLLEAHMDNSPLAIVEFDPEFRVIRWSRSAERMFGYTAEEILGRAISEFRWVHEDDIELAADEALRLASGEHPSSRSVNRIYRKDGTVLWCEWYNSAIRDEEGCLQSILSQVVDTTERVQSTRLAEASANIDQLLHSSLHVTEIMDRAVLLATEAIGADAGVIDSFEGNHFVVENIYGWPADFRGAVVDLEHSGPDLEALRTKRPFVVDDTATDPRVDHEYMDEWGIRSIIAVPLIVRDEGIAVLNLTHLRTPHRFTQAEIAFAERLGTSLSLALENARLFEAEHSIAETLQETLVVVPARVAGIDFSRAYESATAEKGRVGGDFVDVFEVSRDLVAIAIGDVSGKGIDAAVTTSLVRNTLRVHALDGMAPADVGIRTNHVVRRFTSVDSFVTVFFGLLNVHNGLLRYICAGHPPAFVVPAEGEIGVLECPDPILGAFDDVTFSERRTVLARGDRLVMYSDGVTEARASTGGFLDTEGLRHLLLELRDTPTKDMADALIAAVWRFSSGMLRDDAAVLVVEPTSIRLRQADQPTLDF